MACELCEEESKPMPVLDSFVCLGCEKIVTMPTGTPYPICSRCHKIMNKVIGSAQWGGKLLHFFWDGEAN